MATSSPIEYFDLFRALPDKYLLLSAEGIVLDLNDAHASSSLPQRRREDVVGLDFFTVWPPNSDTEGDVVRRSQEHVRRYHEANTMPLIRYDLPRSADLGDGYEQRFWEATHFPVLDSQGQLRYILQKTEDVTERHLAALAHQQMQQKLNEEQERNRFILQALPVMVWTANPAGYCDSSNLRLQQFTGWTPEQLLGQTWAELINPDDQAVANQSWQHAMQHASELQVEYRMRRHDHQYRWLLVRATPRLSPEGQVLMWIGTSTDIHEQKLMVQELLEANEQQAALSDQAYAATQQAESQRDALHGILRDAPAMFAIFRGPEHRYEYINKQYQTLFAGRGDVLGRPVAEAVPEAVEQGFVALLDQVYQSGQSYTGNEMPFRVLPANGASRQVYLNFSYQPYHENGRIAGVTAFAYDVTDLVQARQALEQLRNPDRH